MTKRASLSEDVDGAGVFGGDGTRYGSKPGRLELPHLSR
jgi:hypothetical protein